MHPHDCLAFKMNIHADNSTLHMHMNGTHLMVKIDVDEVRHSHLAESYQLPEITFTSLESLE